MTQGEAQFLFSFDKANARSSCLQLGPSKGASKRIRGQLEEIAPCIIYIYQEAAIEQHIAHICYQF
jgi:hypothetical protein